MGRIAPFSNIWKNIMATPPLPQLQLDRPPINLEQYEAYTPEKLELWDGFYEYGGQDFTGFYLGILANMGLREAVSHVPMSKCLATIQEVASQNSKLDDAIRDRPNMRSLKQQKIIKSKIANFSLMYRYFQLLLNLRQILRGIV